MGIGAIIATAAREIRMDFAHPITSSGLGVAVRGGQTAGWLALVRALVSPAFLKVILTLVMLLYGVGFLVWLLEHKSNPDQFGGTRRQGIFSGFWWAMVTMTTVGYGDTAPRTVGGRTIGLFWMLVALIVVSFFTASITSALTVGQLSDRVSSAAHLGGMRIASVPSSTSASWLAQQKLGTPRRKMSMPHWPVWRPAGSMPWSTTNHYCAGISSNIFAARSRCCRWSWSARTTPSPCPPAAVCASPSILRCCIGSMLRTGASA